jgi:hypothetical protein
VQRALLERALAEPVQHAAARAADRFVRSLLVFDAVLAAASARAFRGLGSGHGPAPGPAAGLQLAAAFQFEPSEAEAPKVVAG